jgi:AIPR protein
MASLIDFNVLNTRVSKYQGDLNLEKPNDAFPYVALETILDLPVNEIENCIVDGSHDRGVDAIYVEEDNNDDNSESIIHLFQFKYTIKPQKISNNFPGGEIDKLLTILEDILSSRAGLQSEVNPALWRKIQDIQEVFTRKSLPKILVYLCGNMESLTPHDKARIEGSLRKYKNLEIEYYTLDRLVESIAIRSPKKINGQIRFIDKQYFERSSGDVKAVIGVVSALDLIELLKDKDNPERIEETLFEDNIRIYQGSKKNLINSAILHTALDAEQNHEFFYLNNGITMTCDNISYTPIRHPLVDLVNIQIVNGSQTSHALFEAYQSLEDKSVLDEVLLLVRIYETGKSGIVTRIVQTTNSQTAISSRDLRANDDVQKKLESELLDKGYYYESKRNYYQGRSVERRLDSQVVGQVLMAFYLARPHEVKFRRREIFGRYYSEIFDEDVVNADNILAPMTIFQYIEKQKTIFQRKVRTGNYDTKMLFIPHASFYILHGIKFALDKHKSQYSYENIDDAIRFYSSVVDILANIVNEAEEQKGKQYSHNSFFRDKRNVNILEDEIMNRI